MKFNWFGFKVGKPGLALAQAHRRFNGRDCASQGFGLVQIGMRDLLYIGSNDGVFYLCLCFVWLTKSTPHGSAS